jgi:hypothetical protein
MSLTAQLALIPIADHRRSSRRRVDFAGFIRDAGTSARAVRLADLSATGCRITNSGTLAEGTEIWLKITDHIPQRALIAWAEGGEAGCEFSTPLDNKVVEELIFAARRKGKRMFRPSPHAQR